ncbi:TPA: hypothetical protein UMV35_003689 [Stenotrophomonas maltophilia]|uniref:hypothetical protein n=1 Tax=Stenotrophomonas sp. GD03680 TaxID=2975365 RepID=UPI00244C3BF4|nr:hypothetical protein [Stenotrophomonas sp. GD03680]MDH2023603.1 hypothetical protein [Stenotrophomonas sp. GD03680]HEL3751351.1 hypothetical protein [Stenotrophomonas maltophilia]HEL7728679.1 hypothetical protein [Stenotrophomonas maltophilia]
MQMKPEFHNNEPRSQVVFRFHQRVLFETGTCERSLAAAIVDNYLDAVPAAHRIVEFHVGTTAETADKAMKANAQIIKRYVTGAVKLPVDLEESWVKSFPDDIRLECKRELARRYGFLGAKAPTAEVGRAVTISCVMREHADVIDAYAQSKTCGSRASKQRLMKEIADAQAALATLQAELAAEITGDAE